MLSERSQVQKTIYTYTYTSHLHKTSRKYKSTETEIRTGANPPGLMKSCMWAPENAWGDGNVLKVDCSNSCKTINLLNNP